MTDSHLVPSVLKTALKTIATDHGFLENCDIGIENLDEENQILNSVYSVVIQNNATIQADTEKSLCLFVKCIEAKEDNSFQAESKLFCKNEIVFYGEVLEGFKDLCRQNKEVGF